MAQLLGHTASTVIIRPSGSLAQEGDRFLWPEYVDRHRCAEARHGLMRTSYHYLGVPGSRQEWPQHVRPGRVIEDEQTVASIGFQPVPHTHSRLEGILPF